MSVFSSIGVQFLCAAGKSHLWKDQGVASDIGHCSDCVVHGCAQKFSVLLEKYKACCRRSSSKALCIWITSTPCIKHSYLHVFCKSHSYCMSFAHLRKTHAHLHFFANQFFKGWDMLQLCVFATYSNQLLCCDMLQFVVCVKHACIIFVRFWHHRSFVWPLTQQCCAGLGLLSLVSPPDLSEWVGGWVRLRHHGWQLVGEIHVLNNVQVWCPEDRAPVKGLNIWTSDLTFSTSGVTSEHDVQLGRINFRTSGLNFWTCWNFMRKVSRTSCERVLEWSC